MTILCDGDKWTTQLERIGKLAKEQKDTIFNNLLSAINEENLIKEYNEMDGNKAIGIDGVTKEEYGRNLRENIKDLVRRIHNGSYHPKAARIVEVPKEDGSTRPLAISCFEDKLIQSVVSKILTAIYEPMFLPCSYGFRENHDCHEALKELKKNVDKMRDGAVVEIDIRKCFNSIPHKELMEMLKEKISDQRFLRLLSKLIRMPLTENGKEAKNTKGCPQGSIISPILANIYLHNVIDKWFESLRKEYFKRKAGMVRFADDMVFVFEDYKEAEKFYNVLPKRLKKYGLELNEAKSQILESGVIAAIRAEHNQRKMGTYKFLGFVCYWGKSRFGRWRLKFKSRRDRFTVKLKAIRERLRKNLNTRKAHELLKTIISAIRGWINYHAIPDNERRVRSFIHKSRWLIYQWFNRRGGKRRTTWERVLEILKRLNFPDRFKVILMF